MEQKFSRSEIYLRVSVSVSVKERGWIPEDGSTSPLDQVPLSQIMRM